MKLNEILTDKDRLKMAYRFLKKEGFNVELNSLWVLVRGNNFKVHVYPDVDDAWSNFWYKNGKKVNSVENLSFEEAVDDIKALKSGT